MAGKMAKRFTTKKFATEKIHRRSKDAEKRESTASKTIPRFEFGRRERGLIESCPPGPTGVGSKSKLSLFSQNSELIATSQERPQEPVRI